MPFTGDAQQLDRTKNWVSQSHNGEDPNTYINDKIWSLSTEFHDSGLNNLESFSRRPSNFEDWEPQFHQTNLNAFPTDSLASDTILPTFSPPGNTLSDINMLPPNWCKKITSTGRVYYFNMITDESGWEHPNEGTYQQNVSKRLGARRFSQASQTSGLTTSSEVSYMNVIPAKVHRTILFNPTAKVESNFSWDGISSNVVCAVHSLIYATKRQSKSRYLSATSKIVEAIRHMLLASGTAEKDAPVFKSHHLLQGYHRQILTSLCDLILLAKVASGIWPPPDLSQRLENEAIAILVATRHFVQTAQLSSVGLRPRKPAEKSSRDYRRQNHRIPDKPLHLFPLPGSSKNRSQSNGSGGLKPSESRRGSHDLGSDVSGEPPRSSSSDILTRFDTAVRSIGIAIECLNDRVTQSSEIDQQLITLVKLVIKEVGQFIGLMDLFSLEGVSDEVAAMFKSYRQTLYDNLSLLVLVTQAVTESYSSNGAGSADQILVTANRIEKSLNDVLVAIKFALEERDLKDYLELRRKLSSFSQIIHGFPPPGSAAVDVAPPLRRCFSLTSLASSVASAPPPSRLNAKESLLSMVDSSGESEEEFENEEGTEESTSSEIISRVDSSRKARKGRSEKFRKILGSDAPFPHEKGKSSNKEAEEKPWFLGHDYSPEDLVFEQGKVRGGTITGLVECLTFHDNWDPNFMATFLLTYRSFVGTSELFRLLFRRFSLEPPAGLAPGEFEVWHEKKLTPIRLRVFNILKTWVETYFQENEDMEALEELRRFAATTVNEALPSVSEQLLRHIEKRVSLTSSSFKKMVKKTQEEPLPIVPKNYTSLLDMDPLEIARQLTLIDSHLFNQIKPVECLNKAWSSKDANAPNVKAMIHMSTQISNWLAFTILSESNLRIRAQYIKYFIAVAERCYSLHNFNTLMSLIAGFNTTPIHRLKRTWELVNARSLQALETIKSVMDSGRNFSTYREQLHSVNPPCVPFLGLYLTDLTFIFDGNSDNLKKSDLINFYKQARSADLIREIQQYQNSTYYLKKLPKLQDYLREKMDNNISDTQLYDRSIELEPREREEEKIARLLQESGFL
ncbi:hypothetical protein DSO57_1012605 [Entomophthora muscae]|uniref:Uncharacterized protein n=1 Tax=Entomophthora muscae TaxID=34485 RepID=A0ACC2RKX2_9FUNG|nr:hypothetical protein DSO57_1012605 [Entomophthora muscae]